MSIVELYLSEEGDKALKEIEKDVCLDRDDVIREALAFYTWVVNKIKQGYKISALLETKEEGWKSVRPSTEGLKNVERNLEKKIK